MRRVTIVAAMLVVSSVEGCKSPTAPTPVIPNVQGRWSGQHAITQCSDTLQFQGFCSVLNRQPGALRPIALTLNQSGDQLWGTIEVGSSSSGAVSGVINSSGQIFLTGSYPGLVAAGDPPSTVGTVTIRDWSTTVSGGNMTGGWSETVTAPRLTGSATIDRQIQAMSKIS